VTPLTDDTNTIDSQLAALTTDIMPTQGNNTAVVLEKAAALFKQSGLQTGQILLITDAVDLDATLPTVKKLANFQLSVLGVGTEDGAPIALPEGGFLKDDQGSIVVTKLNTANLTSLAQTGHGLYQTLTSDDEDIKSLLNAFDKPIQQSKADNDITLEQWNDQGAWLLLLVLPIAALFFRKGLLCVAFLVLLPLPKNSYAFDWQDLWQRPDQQALDAYQKGDYAKAAEKFDNPDWQAAAHYKAGEYEKALKTYQSQTEQTADNLYNQGNALAQAGKLKEAIAAYEQVLKLNPNHDDAKYNKELVEKELEKQQPKQDQKDQNQQQQSDENKEQQSDKQQSSENKNAQSDQQQDSQKNQQSKQQEQQSDEKQKPQKQEKGQEQLEQQEDAKPKEQQKSEQQAEQKKNETKKQAEQQVKPADSSAKNEKQQANEQWLNRIPDDPAGLLRRKFKYQYGRNQ
jgi:Ca-activated chloride channel family protein